MATKATARDAEKLAALHARCFDNSWSAEDFARLLEADTVIGFVGGKDALQSLVLVRVAADECEILTIATAPEARRNGLGREVLRAAAEEACAQGAAVMFLEVAENNHSARAFYSQQGFIAEGRRADYYIGTDGAMTDALLWRAPLPFPEEKPEAK